MLKSPRASLTTVQIGRALALVLSLASLFGGGCYSPEIGDHTLRCAAGGRCPRGFYCHPDDKLCWRTPDAAIDSRPDTDGPVDRADTSGPDDRSDVGDVVDVIGVVDQMSGDDVRDVVAEDVRDVLEDVRDVVQDVRDVAEDHPVDVPPPIDVPVTDTASDLVVDRPTDVCVGAACDPKPNGAPCTDKAMCASGYCVDRVCCNNACQGLCVACDVSPSPGTCSQVNGPPRPGRGSCGGMGACEGSCKTFPDRCTFPAGEVTCAAARCEDTTFTPAQTCNGAGLCASPAPSSCGPFKCNAAKTACLTSCASDNDCSQSAAPYCVQQACAAHRPDGARCVMNAECDHGQCVDGVCCNSPCQGSCEYCNMAGHQGTCTPVASGQPIGNTRPRCNGTGECGGFCNNLPSGACFYYDKSTSCMCSNPLLGLGGCDGEGACRVLGLGGILGALCI